MNPEIIFISDLHIALEKPAITRRFLDFLENRAVGCQSLYILGDLFDVWIGDDDRSPPINAIKNKLRALTESGVAIFLQQGNRDFLLGNRFCSETGVNLLPDYTVIDLQGTPTLLMHGDLLCSDDEAYQQFRMKSHTHEWQQNVLSKPLLIRLLAARWYRIRSHFHKRKKSQEIMDVNPMTVVDTMRQHKVFRLIHGHTHRPAVHDLQIDGQSAQRFVLADWKKDYADILVWREGEFAIERL
ncbi:MAG: UDP-2,3-diacylglucosamine diphosphatase [Methylomicrobium sp.]|nr:UDP-2,3-diacylglucosamine diphosphatase [Methylomicrobium sp.]